MKPYYEDQWVRISHTFTGTGSGSGLSEYTLPQSVNLDFQTGVAADTLVFGSVRWVDQLKLRAAWGQAGNAPDPFASVTSYGVWQTVDPVTGEVLVRILNGALFELAQLSREKAGQQPMARDDRAQAFMALAVLALSDVHAYPVPMAFTLQDFKQVQASVFQVTRSPGKAVVYLGCALLVLGWDGLSTTTSPINEPEALPSALTRFG